MRAVPPHRCPRCGFESLTLSHCTLCDGALVDAEGRVVAPLVARALGGQERRDLAAIGGLAVAGGAMIGSGFLGLLAGPLGVAASIGGSLVAGAVAWRGLRRRRPRGAVDRRLRAALATPVPEDGRPVVGETCVVRGVAHTLRSVVPPGEAPVAAYRERTVGPSRRVGLEERLVPGDTEERHSAGRFAIVSGREVALVDEDWVYVVARGEDPALVSEASLLVLADEALVTVVGPATRGPAQDAGRFAAAAGYRDGAEALVFDGTEAAPVVVIVEDARGPT